MVEKRLEKGLIHIYTGNGKGKTTAAIGQGVRTAGGGFKVLMVQFLKGDDTGELHSIKKLSPNFELIRFAATNKFYFRLTEEEKVEVKKSVLQGLEMIKRCLKAESYNLIIMDEIMAVIYNNVIDLEEVREILLSKPHYIEMILTGRKAPEPLIDLADYVTEMTMMKHPFEKGIGARKGIES
ncbi:cob(I)yrinic acid a,c-diamide adenosyltransferase [Clostridium formicaceticum]|jgi:cob(I)alamin adenosyltransferase|uniref:Cob(I)yrinic acid a,c-diamide adenosyltransferase n=1 Tax=Clostridium formicaceticum TaxID=1497 RepID=A0AAC9RGW3_9CLOT|nr:cob(I)yrinic acid a,c-diamide adenosyltransferase [Clostridium formicaceticum]AOY76345.1 cob(I)yrinic acid a,c-diamide adenosyltransferase [Clostridium formicaceticum]ARE86736.1 Cob(I)yrinic acid a,c-diamide adenosyltransferase [Clostridium formicaceticum]